MGTSVSYTPMAEQQGGNQGKQAVWVGSQDEFVYTQAVPASTWTISHSKGQYQLVACFDQAGVRVEPDEVQPSPDQIILSFSPALAGFAVLR